MMSVIIENSRIGKYYDNSRLGREFNEWRESKGIDPIYLPTSNQLSTYLDKEFSILLIDIVTQDEVIIWIKEILSIDNIVVSSTNGQKMSEIIDSLENFQEVDVDEETLIAQFYIFYDELNELYANLINLINKKYEIKIGEVPIQEKKKIIHRYIDGLNKKSREEDFLKQKIANKKKYLIDKNNNLRDKFPDIAKEWDYEKNNYSPVRVTPGVPKKAWWICPKGHSYEARIGSRTALRSGCPYCTNQKIGYGNDLKTNFPDIAKEWDYEKNNISPADVAPHSNKKAWWICPKGHSYEATIASRTRVISSGCPYCTLVPRSKEEIYLLFELKDFFNINENDHKIKLDKIYDVDIKINNEKIIIEYDGHYWHKDKISIDNKKTSILFNNGWTVIRVRERPLKLLSKKYDVNSIPSDYKVTANNVLKKLSELGFDIPNLNNYIKRKTLINKKEADMYINKLLREKTKKI